MMLENEGMPPMKHECQSLLPMSITIGYWNIRGLAAPLRMLASYAGTPPPYITKHAPLVCITCHNRYTRRYRL